MASEGKAIDVSQLSLQQLSGVKKQIDEELSHLTQSYAQLRRAMIQFKQSASAVAEINPANKEKKVLVPLTTSLYVPGKLTDVENVLVDIGTGYYVKKTTQEADKHYKSKVDYVNKNLETLQQTLEKKQDNANVVVQIMQAKLSAGEKP
ncbi:Prefoldin alpha subunit [Wallemia mellicola CBS 633.66]|uniref:Prefoldin alpha subunit n=1 Tax=Wallemia mellicola (strain ATCC MYA-4683 / CBS 633.66) TaxID=671144 RepID=I4YDU3_WALMC|nr:Prefoldin alpha subunit [Wallemia mellicola CBS 633.66]EIM22135.1 Prefoldin alpha subunit [Wallemia mellicola CBS 633.66]|eukprot:XP_006957935.1 Prefoldin alpha subunit [Wallemia mellicola CBS 633.66]